MGNETFYIKRLTRDSADVNKLDTRKLEFLLCVGDTETDAFTIDQSDEDQFPPLMETNHVPILETSLAMIYVQEKSMPPASQMLYACLRCPPNDLSNYRLYLAPQVVLDESVDAPPRKPEDPIQAEFLEEHSNLDKFLEGKFEVTRLDPFRLEFNPRLKTPPVQDPDNPEHKDHGCFYHRFLFIKGNDPQVEQIKFPNTTVIDLSDDSPTSFPALMKVFIAGPKNQSSRSVSLRQKSCRELVMVESMPDLVLEDQSDRETLDKLGGMTDEEYEKAME